MSDNSTRNQFIEAAWARANDNVTLGALPNYYNDTTGELLAASGTAGYVYIYLWTFYIINAGDLTDPLLGRSLLLWR